MILNLGGFRLFLTKRGLKPSSIVSYTRHLQTLQKAGFSFCPSTTQDFLDEWLLQGKKPAYLNKCIDVLRTYGKFTGGNYTLKQYKEGKPKIETMSDEEIEAFLALPKGKNVSPEWWGKQNVFWSICFFTGCRPGEAAKLTVDDVNLSNMTFIFRNTKTGDDRVVPIAPMIQERVVRYLRITEGYLFPSERGGNKDGLGAVMDNIDWHYSFHSRIKRLGIKRPVRPYSARHSFCSSILPESNLFDTMAIMGHTRPETTMRYYHQNLKSKRRAIDKLPLQSKNLSYEQKKMMVYEYSLSLGVNPKDL